MVGRTVTADPLSEEDLAAARVELADGRPITVWFTPAAVGVPTGGSAKVISIGDAADGDFIQVRPAGKRDTMFCSPNELTRVRPPRKRRVQQATEPAPEPAEPGGSTSPEPTPAPSEAPTPVPVPIAPARSDASPGERPDRARSASRRPPDQPAGVTVTLTATSDGDWTVEVVVGRKRIVRPTPVQPGDVAKAARSLPAGVSDAIESLLDAARRRQLDRVERLRAELDAAQRALQELGGSPEPQLPAHTDGRRR